MKKNSYYLTTKHFVEICTGGGYSENLKNNKRGKIKKLSRSSIKRLCFYVDSLVSFTPKYTILFEAVELENQNEFFKKVKSFCRSLSNEKWRNSKIKIPLFIWKKNIVEGKVQIEIISNLKLNYTDKQTLFICNYIWKKLSSTKITITKIEKENLSDIFYDFCLSFNFEPTRVGRFWGHINGSYYERKEIIKKAISISQLEKTSLNKITENNFIKNNFFKK